MAKKNTSPARQVDRRPITWLHLSDLHTCKPRTGWDAHRVLDPLLRDLQKMQRDHGLAPDLIFFTGDLAFGQVGSGKGERIEHQFDDGQQFLEGVRTAFTHPVPRENVFLVPGNHDVDRGEATEAQSLWLDGQAGADRVTEMIRTGDKEWSRFMERLAAYKAFLKRHKYTHLLQDAERLIYAEQRTVGACRIGIAGLNSAWSCCRDKEKGQLWLGGDWQLGHLTAQLKDADFCVALMHHPVNWFGEYEEGPVKRAVQRDFRFYLHGHEHDEWVEELTDGHVRVAAAACYDRSQRENGYNFVRLDPAAGSGEVWLRSYEPKGGDWGPCYIANKTSAEGLWPLGHLHWLRPDAPREGAAAAEFAARAEPQEDFQRVMDQALGDYHRQVQQKWNARWSRVVDGGDDE